MINSNKTIVTTSWDDGHILDIKLAKLLNKYHIRATFYVSLENKEIKKNDLLSPTDILMLAENFEIGAHTMTHPDLTKIPIKQAEQEINQSKKYLERILNKNVSAFCYPYGEYNQIIKNLVKNSGFILARTTKRYEHAVGNDSFSLPTTLHTYNHLEDLFQIIKFAGFRLSNFLKYLNWEYLAMDLFDYDLKNNGTFHLWGHSWEIEQFNAWSKLEKVLDYVSRRNNVLYLSNSEMF